MGFADVYSFSNGRQRSSHVLNVFRLRGWSKCGHPLKLANLPITSSRHATWRVRMMHVNHLQPRPPAQGILNHSMRFARWSKLMVLSFASSTPMLFQMPTATLSSPILKSTTLSEWDINISPSLNSTSHLVFDSVGSSLQHWTNTRYRNGMLRSNSYT